jgi:hypothetical protein
MEIKMRSAGRYDLQLPELSTPAFSFVTHDAPWMALVHALLGKDAVSDPPTCHGRVPDCWMMCHVTDA